MARKTASPAELPCLPSSRMASSVCVRKPRRSRATAHAAASASCPMPMDPDRNSALRGRAAESLMLSPCTIPGIRKDDPGCLDSQPDTPRSRADASHQPPCQINGLIVSQLAATPGLATDEIRSAECPAELET